MNEPVLLADTTFADVEAPRATHLRPSDIAWQAFQAGAATCGCDTWLCVSLSFMNEKFKSWWNAHLQTTPEGELMLEEV